MPGDSAVTDSGVDSESHVKRTIARFFEFEKKNTNLSTELTAGVTTFLATAYIILLNPQILAGVSGGKPGIILEGYTHAETIQMLAVVTILASVIGMLVMSLYANEPFALAPGLAFSSFVAFTVIGVMGIPWQVGLAAVFTEGILYMVLTAVGARTYIIRLIPTPVKLSVGTGVGLFVTIIGLQNMQIVVDSGATLVTLGNVVSNPVALVGTIGLFLTLFMYARGIQGSIFLGILATAGIGWALTLGGVTDPGVLAPTSFPDATYNIAPLVGAFIDGFEMVDPLTFGLVIFTLFFVDFFGTAGTLTGIGQQAGILDEDGDYPDMDKPLMADAVGTTVGGMLGTTTLSTFVESAAGVEEGGRTGMTTLVIAALFFGALIFVPIAGAVPLYASNVALVLVGLIMLRNVVDVEWSNITHAIPAGMTIVLMPLTFSIAIGIAAGIISYPVVKSAVGEIDDVTAGQWALAGAFVLYFIVRTGGVLESVA
jgi:AGZA family xanthine/uracil permease-like MFS transporter